MGLTGEALGAAVPVSSLVTDVPPLAAGMTSSTTSGLAIVSLSVNTLEGAAHLLSGLGFGILSPPGRFVAGVAASGALALVVNIPRLARTVCGRARGVDGE
jgi:hypothetical protein